METVNDRIEQIINHQFNGNKSAFCKATGLVPTVMSTYLGKQRRSRPNIEMIAKIITALDVDPRWLLTGEQPKEVKVSPSETPIGREDCPKLSELEKENAELKDRLLEAQQKLIECQSVLLRMADENARLKGSAT